MVLAVVQLPDLLVPFWKNLLLYCRFHLFLLVVLLLDVPVLVHVLLYLLWTVVWVLLLYLFQQFALFLFLFRHKVLEILLVPQMARFLVVYWRQEVLNLLYLWLTLFVVLFSQLSPLFVLLLQVLHVLLVLLLIHFLLLLLLYRLHFFQPIFDVLVVLGFQLRFLFFHFRQKGLNSFALLTESSLLPVLFFLKLFQNNQRLIAVILLMRKGIIKMLRILNLTDVQITQFLFHRLYLIIKFILNPLDFSIVVLLLLDLKLLVHDFLHDWRLPWTHEGLNVGLLGGVRLLEHDCEIVGSCLGQ